MLGCYECYSTIESLYKNGSTGGVASTLGYFLLNRDIVDNVLVMRRSGTFLARTLNDCIKSCGSIYQNLPYDKMKDGKTGQIGKPCDMDDQYCFRISLFCSGVLKEDISKKQLRSLSSSERYFFQLKNKPFKCMFCRDHMGVNADVSVGDSQLHPKINHIIIHNEKGARIFNDAVDSGLIYIVREIDIDRIKHKQPYLFSGGILRWLLYQIR